MSYYMKLTVIGAAKIAAAQAGGPVVSLTYLAVGDGNGSPVGEPTGNETALVREVYRGELSALYVNPGDNTIIMAEGLVPSDVGEFSVREVGIFDAEEELFAYGNFPETYKPVAGEGSTREMVIVAAIKVADASVVTLLIDTSVVTATREWALATFTAAYLIPGGLTDEFLAKNSDADGDFKWVDVIGKIPTKTEIYFMGQL